MTAGNQKVSPVSRPNLKDAKWCCSILRRGKRL